jgi:hypothetical protein
MIIYLMVYAVSLLITCYFWVEVSLNRKYHEYAGISNDLLCFKWEHQGKISTYPILNTLAAIVCLHYACWALIKRCKNV